MSNIIDDNGGAVGVNNLYCQNLVLSEGPSKLIREELKKSAMGKYAKLLQLLGAKGKGGMKGMDIRDQMMLLLEIVLAEMDKNIFATIKQLQKLSKDQKKVSEKKAEKNPGLLNGMNTDSSILQTKLTMFIQERQRFVEAINNAFKSFHDQDENTIRRMV